MPVPQIQSGCGRQFPYNTFLNAWLPRIVAHPGLPEVL